MLKINDWVRDLGNNRIFQIKHIGKDSYFNDDKLKSVKFDKAELWGPKENEWCWFVNEENNAGELVKVVGREEDGTYYGYASILLQAKSDYVEPYIFELPTFTKNKIWSK